MDTILKQKLIDLSQSGDKLSNNEIKKIYSYLPIPNDYHLILAEISSLGGYPVGIAFTEEALIYKSSKKGVKEFNKQIKNGNKKNKEKQEKINVVYKIIPWEYFNISDYELKTLDDGSYRLCKTFEHFDFFDKDIYEFFKDYKERKVKIDEINHNIFTTSSFSSINTINASTTMFGAKNGIGNTKTGHGFYAEEAGSSLDKLYGEESTVVGYDNAPNGADKIVNGINVQCKYCRSAEDSINACFKDFGNGEEFRYLNLDDTPMQIEVSKDQYLEVVELMKQKIREGKVPGISDEDQAFNIIREGKLTYKQASNLAKAGTVESITYDIKNGAINCLWAFGISAAFSFFVTFSTTKDLKQATKAAFFTGLEVYGLSLIGSVLSAQLARTSVIKVFDSSVEILISKFGENGARTIINSFRRLAGLTPVGKQTLTNSMKHFLSVNELTTCTMFLVVSIPDIYRVINRNISKTQFLKNIFVLITGMAGSMFGNIAAGALLGGTYVGKINKKLGASIGFFGGAFVGFAASTGMKKALDFIKEDDKVIFYRMFEGLLYNVILDYMLNEKEQVELLEFIQEDKKGIKTLVNNNLKSKMQAQAITDYIVEKVKPILEKREKISVSDDEINDEITYLIMNGELDNGM